MRPDFDEKAALAEYDVTWALESKLSTDVAERLKAATLGLPGAREFYLDELASAVAVRAFLSDHGNYPDLTGLRPDLYRCFMTQTWRHMGPLGIDALIYFETHFTDEKAGILREEAYHRLRVIGS